MSRLKAMSFQQVETTGSRLVGAISKLGHIGPKHHGIVIGEDETSREVYVAENNHTGYQLVTIECFIEKYTPKGDVLILPNDGEFSDVEVAQRALNEILQGGKGIYNIVVNNCESFSNRAMYDKDFSKQVLHVGMFVLFAAGAYWYLKNTKK